jgi:hypothetical protein
MSWVASDGAAGWAAFPEEIALYQFLTGRSFQAFSGNLQSLSHWWGWIFPDEKSKKPWGFTRDEF